MVNELFMLDWNTCNCTIQDPCHFFAPALAGGLSLESKLHQVSSYL